MNELTYHLSIRYGRPITSIVLSLQHGMCLLFGGSFDPAYIMTITALPDQVMATTNRRNVALFQAHLQQALRVPPTRGLVQFVPISEECLGYRRETLAAAMGSSTRQGSQNYDTTDSEWRRSRVSTMSCLEAIDTKHLMCLVAYVTEACVNDVHGTETSGNDGTKV